MHRVVAIIPARYNSTRFPGKPLAILKEKPLVQHVYEQTKNAKLIDAVSVATDDKRIFDIVQGFGGNAVMTSPEHASGTDRVAEAAREIECDIIVNVQGDEPFIKPEMIDDVINILLNDEDASIGTLAKRITDVREIISPDVVKVVFDNKGFAMYFSRAPIPYHRDEWQFQITENRAQKTYNPPSPPHPPLTKGGQRRGKGGMGGFVFKFQTPDTELQTFYCYKHIGIYAFRKDVLLNFSAMQQGRLEMIEKLEQLRALDSKIKIKVKETGYDTFGIDTPEDIKKAEEWLNLYS